MLGTKSRSDAAASEATVKEKAVIGALADRAGPDHKARKVILSYTPGLNYKTLRKNIKKFDTRSTRRLQHCFLESRSGERKTTRNSTRIKMFSATVLS